MKMLHVRHKIAGELVFKFKKIVGITSKLIKTETIFKIKFVLSDSML